MMRRFLFLALALPLFAADSPQVAEVRRFLEKAEARLLQLSNDASRAGWVQATYITPDTEALAAAANEVLINTGVEYAKQAARYDKVQLPADLRRKLTLLKTSLTLATPKDPKLSSEISALTTRMEGNYGKGKYCPKPDACKDIQELSRTLATSQNPAELLEAWQGWHTVGRTIRPDFERFVTLSNQGARELNFADTGSMWRSKYDMTPAEFSKEVDRLWSQVKPLYVSLHAYTRKRLLAKYGPSVVPANGPIPAHLLGNMWSQSWENLYPILKPENADPGYDLTKILEQRKSSALDLVRFGESMYVSLGFALLPKTFWERSQFTKPRDRDVVCHASAWDVDNVDDLRIKMCIEPTAEDFFTVYHELGHNYYQRAYNTQPFLFRDGANDGFHEAIGDTIQLSITPGYLKQLGLIQSLPPEQADIGLLLNRALEKVAFLPFGLLIDQWRWKVFSGEIKPADYNKSWWDLRRSIQGIAPPVERSEADFDPGAKYHVPANVPYTRYFLAHVLQFQFHRALAIKSGCDLKTTPLHRCSAYNSKEAGKAFNDMLALGASKPWPEALEKLTGSRQIDASAIIDYFAPLKKWLDEQNAGSPTGWN